eukprot:Gb_06481 [translate_table: standard]
MGKPAPISTAAGAAICVLLILLSCVCYYKSLAQNPFFSDAVTPCLNNSTSSQYSTPWKAIEGTQCDLFSGKWIRDESYPLYAAGECPYLSAQVSCQKNDRPDSDYQHWRWQPRDCRIPRFNATDMLERMRGKRLMFVGDSINRNQWESMVCLLQSDLPNNKKFIDNQSHLYKVFKAKEYNCSVEFFWAPFLVELDETNKILRLDSIENHGEYWKGVDMLVFNSAHWWSRSKFRTLDLFEQGNQTYKELECQRAYGMALKTWATWIDSNVDPRTTQVFFRTTWPSHTSSKQWNDTAHKQRCYNERDPIVDDSYIRAYLPGMRMVEEVVREMKVRVSFLNVTALSDYRKDAHTSVYTERRGKMLTLEQRNDPRRYADCSHWCLPGLPDIWNELLYAFLFFSGGHSSLT